MIDVVSKRQQNRFGRAATLVAAASLLATACGSGEVAMPLEPIIERQSAEATAGVDIDPRSDLGQERLAMARRDLSVSLIVPDEVKPGDKFDVEVRVSVQTFSAQGVDLSFTLPEDVEIVEEGACWMGSGDRECVDVIQAMDRNGSFTVRMQWKPTRGSEFADIQVFASDDGIARLGMDVADGNPDNNTATARIRLPK